MGGLIHCGGWHGLEWLGEHERRLLIFEPGTEAFQALQANLGGRPNVTLVNAAVGASTTTAPLHMSLPSHSSSLLTPCGPVTADHPVHFTGAAEEVRVHALDDFIADPDAYDALQIDAQGYELEVLKGATRTLKNLKRVELELHDPGTYKGAASLGEIDVFMADQGWRQVGNDVEGSDGLGDVTYEPANG